VILALQVAVVAVTVLLLSSLAAVVRGNYRLHGRINRVFFVLTLSALLLFEVVIRLVKPDVFAYLDDPANEGIRKALNIHLCFSVPSALLLPVMLYTGSKGRGQLHLTLAVLFGLLWTGTFVTGVFFLR
jgi:uncharacterized membrane protein YozB (DUF420 family)